MPDDAISYRRIARAQEEYAAMGYRNIETPWMVSEEAIRVTLPPDCASFQSAGGSLVGSAEQGFIQMMLDGTLMPGRYQSTGPCFRDEKKLSDLTRRWFMKLELIHYMPAEEDFSQVLRHAHYCMCMVAPHVRGLTLRRTPDGTDIEHCGIELGSYGVRRMGEHIWVYGTGLAEPRFSLAMQTTGR